MRSFLHCKQPVFCTAHHRSYPHVHIEVWRYLHTKVVVISARPVIHIASTSFSFHFLFIFIFILFFYSSCFYFFFFFSYFLVFSFLFLHGVVVCIGNNTLLSVSHTGQWTDPTALPFTLPAHDYNPPPPLPSTARRAVERSSGQNTPHPLCLRGQSAVLGKANCTSYLKHTAGKYLVKNRYTILHSITPKKREGKKKKKGRRRLILSTPAESVPRRRESE